MSSWVSRKQDHTKDGIPHLTKIIRKPKGVGTEVKCLADDLPPNFATGGGFRYIYIGGGQK